MSHKGISLLIEDTAKSLGDDIQFDYARTSDFNITASAQRYPFITLDLLSSTPSYTVNNTSNYQKTWFCQMAFYALSPSGATQSDSRKILDDIDLLVDNFINKLNFYSEKSDSIVLTSISQQPFIEATSAKLTGFLLNFQLQAQDDFNYCGLDC